MKLEPGKQYAVRFADSPHTDRIDLWVVCEKHDTNHVICSVVNGGYNFTCIPEAPDGESRIATNAVNACAIIVEFECKPPFNYARYNEALRWMDKELAKRKQNA